MRLTELKATRYRSIREETVSFGALTLLIGANASGKSNILNALRLLAEAIRAKDFDAPVNGRGGIVHLAWKGEDAHQVGLEAHFEADGRKYSWSTNLVKREHGNDFFVRESVWEKAEGEAAQERLHTADGQGWWWSADAQQKIYLEQGPTECALAAASTNKSFPARELAEFTRRWGFFDPSPPSLRWSSPSKEASNLDSEGKNLAARLLTLRNSSPALFERIIRAIQSVLGIPQRVSFNETEDRVFLRLDEAGLLYPVAQIGASSGTLRMLAMMTALFGESEASLVGIEEPENHIHPSAIVAFAEQLRAASTKLQVVVTTHSPLLLNCFEEPEIVRVVRRTPDGTKVLKEENPEAIRLALEESGFGLGEFYETKGFGA